MRRHEWRRIRRRRLLASAFILLFPLASIRADAPVRAEQLIWSVIAFNGRDYSATFAPETSGTIYLLAGAPSILSPRATFVYWWPITSEWRTDTDSLNVPFPGTLEVHGESGADRTIPLQEYTYFNVRGEYEINWKVATGDAARAEIQDYKSQSESYFAATRAYQLGSQEYDRQIMELEKRIVQLRQQGEDTAALVERMRALPRPEAPSPPSYYLAPPSDLQRAFIVNLPPGRYSIRLRNPDGSIMDGSDKTLVVHERRRAGRVGYEVIPSDKWTRPEESVTPSSVLYVNGSADLYLRPFFEDELNDLAYQKTVDNGSRGNAYLLRWVRIQQVPRATIEVRDPGGVVSTLREERFLVTQTQGAGLGYTIAPWNPGGPDKAPNLIAFRLAVRGKAATLHLRVLDAQGKPLAGGEREVRVLAGRPHAGLSLVFALLPLLAMTVVLVLRFRFYARGPADED
jgi:hypothetical protein